jgi:hypothetical protein
MCILCARNIRFYGSFASVKVVIELGKVKLCHYGPGHALSDFRSLMLPEFLGSRDMKVVRLSAVRTGSLYAPGDIPGTHFC